MCVHVEICLVFDITERNTELGVNRMMNDLTRYPFYAVLGPVRGPRALFFSHRAQPTRAADVTLGNYEATCGQPA